MFILRMKQENRLQGHFKSGTNEGLLVLAMMQLPPVVSSSKARWTEAVSMFI